MSRGTVTGSLQTCISPHLNVVNFFSSGPVCLMFLLVTIDFFFLATLLLAKVVCLFLDFLNFSLVVWLRYISVCVSHAVRSPPSSYGGLLALEVSKGFFCSCMIFIVYLPSLFFCWTLYCWISAFSCVMQLCV